MNDKGLGNMKSIELFYKLRELLDRNPRVINELPLDDMKACIFVLLLKVINMDLQTAF